MSTTRPNVTRVVRPRSGSGLIPQNNSLQSLPPEPPSFSTFDFSKRPRSRDLPASPVTSSRCNQNKALSVGQDYASEEFLQRQQREKQVAAWDAQLEARNALWNELSPDGKGGEFKNDDDDDDAGTSPAENRHGADEDKFEGAQDTGGGGSVSARNVTVNATAAAADAAPEASHVPLDFFAEPLNSPSPRGEPVMHGAAVGPFLGAAEQDSSSSGGYGGSYGDAAADAVFNAASLAAEDQSRAAAVAELSTYLQQLRGQTGSDNARSNGAGLGYHDGDKGAEARSNSSRGVSAVVFPDDFDTRLERMSRRDLFSDQNFNDTDYHGDGAMPATLRDSSGAPPWAGYLSSGGRGTNGGGGGAAGGGGGGAWAAYQGALAADEEQQQEKKGGNSRAPPVDPALLAGGLAQIAELDSQLAAVQDKERAAAAAVRAQSRGDGSQQQQQHGGALSGEAAEPARPKRLEHARSVASRLEVEESPRGRRADTARSSRKSTAEDEASTTDSAPGLSARDRAFLTDMGGRGRRNSKGYGIDDQEGSETARRDATSPLDTARSSVQSNHRAIDPNRGTRKNKNGGAPPAKDFVAANVAKARAARGNAATSSLTPDEESRVASLVGDLSQLLDGSDGTTGKNLKGKHRGKGKHQKGKKGGSKSKGENGDGDDDDDEGDAAEVLEAQLAAQAAAAAEAAVWQAMGQWGVDDHDGGGLGTESGAAKTKRLAGIDEALAALGAKEPITLGKVYSWSGADLAAAQAAADAAANFENEDPENIRAGQGHNGADLSSSSASSKACGELALEVARQQRQVAQRMQELDDQLKRLGGAQCLVADRNLPSGTPRLQAAGAATAAFTTATAAGAGAGASSTKQGQYGQLANGSHNGSSPVGGGGRGLAELRKRRRQRQAAEQAEDGHGTTVQREGCGDGSHTDRTASPRPNTGGDRGGSEIKGEQTARDENGELVYVVSRSQISLAVAEARRRNEEDRARLARASATSTSAESSTTSKNPQGHNVEAGAGDLGADSVGESNAAQRAAAEEAEAQRRAAVEAEDKRRLQALLSSVGPDVVNLRERRASAAAAAEASAKAAAAAAIAADGGDTQGLVRRRPEDGSPTGPLPHRERGMIGSENKGATDGYYVGDVNGDEETSAWALEEKKQERRRRRAERRALHEKKTSNGAQLPPAVAELFRAPFPAADDE